MAEKEPNRASGQDRGAWFTTTHWSVVLAAKTDDAEQSAKALEELCRTYWPPLYAYIRREGYDPHEAQDLTQEFLTRFVHREWLNHLQDQRGKFRSFLLTFLKHFLSDERDRANARKRGGRNSLISLDAYAEEERHAMEAARDVTADVAYDRRWARAVIDRSIQTLAGDYAARGKTRLFEQLKDIEPGQHGERSYAQIGASLGMSEQAVANAIHAFRRRYREILRQEIAQTVSSPDKLEEELRYMLSLFSR